MSPPPPPISLVEKSKQIPFGTLTTLPEVSDILYPSNVFQLLPHTNLYMYKQLQF